MIRQKWAFVVILILSIFSVQAKPQTQVDKLDQAIQRSLAKAAEERPPSLLSANQLQIASAAPIIFQDTGYEAYRVKIFDPQQTRITTYWYDENLSEITSAQAFEKQAAAYELVYGRLSRNLFDVIAQNTTGTIPVAIWANQSFTSQVQNPAPPAGGFRVYLPAIVGGQLSPLDAIRAFLTARGYAIDYVSQEAPVIYANLQSQHIQELQAQSYVAAIYEQAMGYPLMESAARTAAAPWTWSRGITGAGIKVAVIEDDGVAFDNPYINGSKYYIDWWKRIGSHATEVAGVIASTHSMHRGIAYGAEILSANALSFAEPMVVAATDWAIAENVNVLNASFGTVCQNQDITSEDKYFDWVVWNKKKTTVVSAGNLLLGCPSNYNVSSPGKAYNVITVGAKNDQNTAQTEADVKDDVFSSFSLYVDPVTASSNRLKPEVVTTGQRITTTSESDPWITSEEVAGTSFSAPIVAGQAALMMQRSSWLKTWPEAVKAGIMATARWTQLHDDKNYSQMASMDKMGVGAIDVTASDNSLINNRIRGIELRQNDLQDGYYYDVSMSGCNAGERLRVVITWPSHPSRLPLNWVLHDRLESDFDLLVLSPSYKMYLSAADEANYEIVELIMPEAGTYTARIMMMRWDNASMTERVGFAYYCGSPLD